MGRSEAAPPPGHALRPGDDTARCSFGEADLLSELGAIESVTPPVPARKLHRTRTSRNLERDCRGLCDELGLGTGACEPDVEARRRREPSPTSVFAPLPDAQFNKRPRLPSAAADDDDDDEPPEFY